ncbi:Protein YLS9 [Forsythia ovata]|uniref:Protein YLS9 n=1 Tax=Forsythia ovata TaxID=205694 RepID=A0ABD1WWW1_9LAMI
MGDRRQSNLNGAYYGPSAPPLPQKYHHPVRRGRSGGCNPFSCCCGCLFNCLCTCLCQLIFSILFSIGHIIFICWLIFRPNAVKLYATNASLTEFTLDNNTLHYNLALNLTIRNPNKRIGIDYDRIEARAFYEDERFASTELTPFYQGHKSTNSLTPEFKGQKLVLLGNEEISNYKR